MPNNASEWVGFVFAIATVPLLLLLILTFVAAFLDPFFGVGEGWWRRGKHK